MATTGESCPLAVPVIGQPTGYSCGNTSLAAVARFFGRPASLTVEHLGRLARTSTEGTDHRALVDAARMIGATVFVKSRGTLDELAQFVALGLPPILGWWSMEPRDVHHDPRWKLRVRKKKDCGHYSVVTEVTATRVTLMDPQDNDAGETWGPHGFAREQFARIWYDTDGPRFRKVERWFMVANFEGRRFADGTLAGEDLGPL